MIVEYFVLNCFFVDFVGFMLVNIGYVVNKIVLDIVECIVLDLCDL